MSKIRLIALLSLVLTSAAAGHVRAQNGKDFRNVHINGGPEAAFPINSFADTHNMAVGGSLQLAIPFAFRFFLLGHAGYNRHWGSGGNDPVQIVPYRIGARMRLIGSTYIGAQGGAASRIQGDNNVIKLSFAGGVGVANQRIDVGARYEHHAFAGTTETVVLRVAYVIGLQVGSARR